MKRKILLENSEVRKMICRTLGISGMLLSYALNFKRNSRKCIAARQMALENGGILMEEKEVTRKTIIEQVTSI